MERTLPSRKSAVAVAVARCRRRQRRRRRVAAGRACLREQNMRHRLDVCFVFRTARPFFQNLHLGHGSVLSHCPVAANFRLPRGGEFESGSCNGAKDHHALGRAEHRRGGSRDAHGLHLRAWPCALRMRCAHEVCVASPRRCGLPPRVSCEPSTARHFLAAQERESVMSSAQAGAHEIAQIPG